MLLGVITSVVLVGGLVLNTLFLIREIRRGEQHDAFIHAVTHELKTPLASIKLYLQTLRQRELPPGTQHEVIDTMLDDSTGCSAPSTRSCWPARPGTRAGSITPPTSTCPRWWASACRSPASGIIW